MTPIYGNCVGGVGLERTYILVDENGNEYPATFVDNETSFDATANDIREGKVAATNAGMILGEKFIPPYYTSVGVKAIPAGSECVLPLPIRNAYDYTSLQCIICPYNNSIAESVAAEKVVIGDNVYNVSSTVSVAEVTKDVDAAAVRLGITNNSDTLSLIRFFTYKEET